MNNNQNRGRKLEEKVTIILLLFTLAIWFFFIRTNPHKSDAAPNKPIPMPASSNPIAKSRPTSVQPDPVFGIDPAFKPSYKVVKVESSKDNQASHANIRITVPLKLTRAELEQNLRYAVKSEYDKNHTSGIVVFGYMHGKSTVSEYRAVFAPYGDLLRVEYEDYKIIVTLDEDYFKSEKQIDTEHGNAPRTGEDVLDKMDDEYRKAEKDVRKRFTAEQRGRIADEVDKAQARAEEEAIRAVPLSQDPTEYSADKSERQIKLQADLEEKYLAAIRRKHHLTEDELNAIMHDQ